MKPILVTGGAKGLGAEICQRLSAEGHEVVVHYRTSAQEAEAVASLCHGDTIQGDFTTQASLEDFIARYQAHFPETKGIVNNVGNYLIASAEETTSKQWHELFQVNFFAPVLLTQALLPALRRQRGSIVNLGVAGLEGRRGVTKMTAYAATKSALHFYMTSLAKELAKDRVRVNMISPGFMENHIDQIDVDQLPMKRVATLREVAAIIATFFHPETAYITGQNIEISGGFGL